MWVTRGWLPQKEGWSSLNGRGEATAVSPAWRSLHGFENRQCKQIWEKHFYKLHKCIPGMRRQTQFSKCRLFCWRISSVPSPGGQWRSCALSISSSTQCIGQPLSSRDLRITDCSAASGVDIIPPQRSTLAIGSDVTHLNNFQSHHVNCTSVTNSNNNTEHNVYGTVIVTYSHCESLSGSRDECRAVPDGCQPVDQADQLEP